MYYTYLVLYKTIRNYQRCQFYRLFELSRFVENDAAVTGII